MKLAILSDIHGNLEAFERVLEDMDTQSPDAVYCLGDSVGYGPEPEAVTELLRARDIPQVCGNHELAMVQRAERIWFNPTAKEALERSRKLVSRRSLKYMRTLPLFLSEHGCYFVHGFPPDSPRIYLFERGDDELPQTFTFLNGRVCFVGHTHELGLVEFDGKTIRRTLLSKGAQSLHAGSNYIVNVGSVGQPRDGDNRAKYVLYDTEQRRLQVRCVPYDIARTATAIIALGLPEQYARRLW